MNAALMILDRIAAEIEETANNPSPDHLFKQMAQWAKEIRSVCATIKSLDAEMAPH